MSNALLNSTDLMIDVGDLLDGLARTLGPIARLRGIRLNMVPAVEPIRIKTSLEEVLPVFCTLWIKLLYLLQPNSRFDVAARLVVRDEATYLRLQITTIRLYINPTVLLSNGPKIAQLDNSLTDSSLIYIDLLLTEPVHTTPTATVPAEVRMPPILQSEKLATATKQRISQFAQDTLTLDKVRASASVQDSRFLDTVGQLIDENLANIAFDSGVMERELGLSRTQLFRKLKKLTGFSTANYIRQVRLCKARGLLEATILPIGEVASRVGFPELSYFSHCFAEAFKQTPSDWRRKGRMKQ